MGRYFLPPISDAGPNNGQPFPNGPHYLNVDEQTPNDADYVKSLGSGGAEAYGIDSGAIPKHELITNVDVVWRQAGTHADVATAQAGLRFGSMLYLGPVRNLQDHTFTTYTEHFVLNPSTGLPWQHSDLILVNLYRLIVFMPQEVGWPRMSQCVAFADTVEPPPRYQGTGSSRGYRGIGYPRPDPEGEGS